LIHAKLLLCADSTVIDARTNAISAFHIMEQLNSPAFPVALPRISIIALLTREEADPSEKELQLQIYLGAQRLFAGPMPVAFVQQLSTRAIVDLHGLVIPAPGDVRVVIANEEAALGSWVIKVNQVGQPEMQMHLPVQPAQGENRG
jgi:hypothetical protein